MGIIATTLGFWGDMVAQHVYQGFVPLPQRRFWNFEDGSFTVTDDPDNECLNFAFEPALIDIPVALADATDVITIAEGLRRIQLALGADRVHTVSVEGAKHGDVMCLQRSIANVNALSFVNGGPDGGTIVSLAKGAFQSAWLQCIADDPEDEDSDLNWTLYQYTSYGAATSSTPGLLSAADKVKLDDLSGAASAPVALADATATILLSAGRKRIRTSACAADRNIRLSSTDAELGDLWEITYNGAGTAFAYTIIDEDSLATILTFSDNALSTAVFYFDGTNWALYRVMALYAGATTTLAGLMSASQAEDLSLATSSPTVDTIARRDGAGDCEFNEILVGGVPFSDIVGDVDYLIDTTFDTFAGGTHALTPSIPGRVTEITAGGTFTLPAANTVSGQTAIVFLIGVASQAVTVTGGGNIYDTTAQAAGATYTVIGRASFYSNGTIWRV